MSTLGDPLADLGLFLLYWGRGEAQAVTGNTAISPDKGFLDRDAVIARYDAATGLDLSQLDWYEVFASFKLAIIVAGIHARYLMGMTLGEGFDHMGAMVNALAHGALEFASKSELKSLKG
jgi:aminoglycoside phosphotransferase (APT) family kinase protein